METMFNQINSSHAGTGRLLDGPLLVFDLPSLMEKIKNEDSYQKNHRNAITLLKTDSMRLVLIALQEGADIDFRQSENLISLQILKGKIEFHAEKETTVLDQGQLLTLHENIQHSLIAASETMFLLTIGNCNTHTV